MNKVFRVSFLSFSLLAGVAGLAKLTSLLGRSSLLSRVLSSSEPELAAAGVLIWDCQAGVRSQPRLTAISSPLSGGEQEVSSREGVQAVGVAGEFFSGEDWAAAEEGVLAGGGSVVGDLDLFLEGGDLESLRGLKVRVLMVLS